MEQNKSNHETASLNQSYGPDTKDTLAILRQEHARQREDHSFQLKQQDSGNAHQQKIEDKRLGVIGRFFGARENASKNITATICILLMLGVSVVSLYAYIAKEDVSFVQAMWQSISPVIPLSLGYLFGKK